MGFATSVLAGSGSTRHGLPPPKPKILATPLQSTANLIREHAVGSKIDIGNSTSQAVSVSEKR